MAAGCLVVAGCFLSISVPLGILQYSSRKLLAAVFKILGFMISLYLLSVVSFAVNRGFDFSRFWQAYLFLAIFITAAFCFVILARRLSQERFNSAVKFVFYVLLGSGVAGILHYSPFTNNRKAVFFYSEPSHYALSFLPFLMYMVVISQKRTKHKLLFCSLVIALLLQNLTLLIGIVLISALAIPLKRVLLLVPLIVLIFAFVDTQYYASRLDLSRDNKNLSALVYMQGWERAYLNLRETSGLGVGFQQFGIVGSRGSVLEELALLNAGDLNLLDGGSVASKFIGEFGAFGAMLLWGYLFFWARFYRLLRRISMRQAPIPGCRQVFFLACFVMFFIDLFVRGTGYFSSSGFLLAASLISAALSGWLGNDRASKLPARAYFTQDYRDLQGHPNNGTCHDA